MNGPGYRVVAWSALLALALAGCTYSEAIDCGRICARYDDCKREIDTEACQDRCTAKADEQDAMDTLVDDCEACIDRGTCAQIDDCWESCAPLLD